jgi:hypothetical protein
MRRANSGNAVPSATSSSSSRSMLRSLWPKTTPNSAKCALMALIRLLRWIKRSRGFGGAGARLVGRPRAVPDAAFYQLLPRRFHSHFLLYLAPT